MSMPSNLTPIATKALEAHLLGPKSPEATRISMPSSAKRKEERAKKARDDRRLAILYFPSAFGTKVSLDAHVDLLRSLTSDEADNDNLAHLEESIRVYGSALRILIKHLCTAAEKKRILDSVTTSAVRDRAWRYMTTQLQTSIDSAYNIAGLVQIERATCRMHVAYRNTSMNKVPKAVPMLDFFQDTRTAYDELKEALNEHMQLCESMDEDYTSGTLNEVEIAVLTANLERVWRCRANQLIHATIKTQLEELSTKFFEDKDAYKEATQVLDELEEGFKASWEYVVKSEARVRLVGITCIPLQISKRFQKAERIHPMKKMQNMISFQKAERGRKNKGR